MMESPSHPRLARVASALKQKTGTKNGDWLRAKKSPLFHLRSVGIILLLLACGSAAFGEDWTQWGGRVEKNMVSEAKGLPDSFVPGKKRPSGGGIDMATTENVAWVARLGSIAYGNPTVAEGKVFVGTDDLTLTDDPRFKRTRGGLVKCFDQTTGRQLWQLVVPQRTQLPRGALFGHQHLGICSSPAVEDGRVYVVSSACEVLCLDANGMADGNDGPFQDEATYMVGADMPPIELKPTDADILWSFDMIEQCGVVPHDAASCSALLLGEMLYVSTSNGVDLPHTKVLSPLAPSLIVLEKQTGRMVATDAERIGERLYHAQWSSPSAGRVGGKTLVFFGGGDGVCYAFEAVEKAAEKPVELKKVWSYDCNPAEYKFRDGKERPYYDGDRRKKRGNKNDGKYIGPSQIIATPVFHEGRIYIAIGQDPAHGRGKGLIHCIDATKTGNITESGRLWSYDGLDRSISTVAVDDHRIYIPDIAGRLHCLNADTGDRIWSYDTGSEAWGSTLIADGKIYLGTKRDFFIFAVGNQPEVLAKIRLGAPVYSSPIVAGGVLYLASNQYLWAVRK